MAGLPPVEERLPALPPDAEAIAVLPPTDPWVPPNSSMVPMETFEPQAESSAMHSTVTTEASKCFIDNFSNKRVGGNWRERIALPIEKVSALSAFDHSFVDSASWGKSARIRLACGPEGAAFRSCLASGRAAAVWPL